MYHMQNAAMVKPYDPNLARADGICAKTRSADTVWLLPYARHLAGSTGLATKSELAESRNCPLPASIRDQAAVPICRMANQHGHERRTRVPKCDARTYVPSAWNALGTDSNCALLSGRSLPGLCCSAIVHA